MLGNGDLRGGVIQGATERIHPSVPALIEKYSQHVTVVDDPGQERFFRMLLFGRIDYFFTYPFNFQAITTRMGIREKLVFLNFAEQNQYRRVYVFLTNTAESARVLKTINDLIATEEFTKRSVTALLQYLPESIHPQVAGHNGLRGDRPH